MVIGIIGAGASGMAAAIKAAQQPEVQVVLFERQARVGRKLLATGNGRCNLTNMHATGATYHGQTSEFALRALAYMDPQITRNWFADLGLYTIAEASGRVYPYSDQANSVVDVLRLALQKPNITLKLGFEVKKLRRDGSGFSVENEAQQVYCDKIIVASGGLAGTKLGGSMSGYKLLQKMGHKVTRLRPTLVQLKCAWSGVTALKGVRANCSVRIMCNDALFAQSIGELQFTDYGLSGPVVFEVSRDVCQQPGRWTAQLDFLPDWSLSQLENEITRRKTAGFETDELLTGVLHNRLGRVLTKAAGVKSGVNAECLDERTIAEICRSVKAFEVELTEPMGMDCAQVTAGGVVTAEFDPETMESRIVPGLYACGEVLDIDGDCGGYNLQWAWSSGNLAGLHAGKDKA